MAKCSSRAWHVKGNKLAELFLVALSTMRSRRLLPATVHPPVSPPCLARENAGIAVAIANARRVRSSVDHAVRWGDQTRHHDALSVLFPRAASIRYSQTVADELKRKLKTTTASAVDIQNRPSKSKLMSERSSAYVVTPVCRERNVCVYQDASKKAVGSMCKKGLRRKIIKRASWLPVLPADVLERVVRMYAARSTVTQLLQVAKASDELARAVVAVADSTFDLDERTLPNIGQWATIFRSKVRTLRVHRRLRRYPRDVVFQPMRTLITARSLEHVTVPAIPVLLRALAYLPNLISLGVYVRNREDAMALLTLGGAVISTVSVQGRDGQVASRRQHFKPLRLQSLQIHCVQHDDAKDDPFCFTNACAVDHLTSNEVTTRLFARTFRTVTKVSINCHHRLLCDTGRLLNALPFLSEVELNTPADMTELTRDALLKMKSVHLCGVHESAQLAATLGARVASLRIHEITLTRDMVSGLAGCTQLQELDMVLEAEAERSLTKMSFTRLRKLRIRWVYNTVDVFSPETGRTCRIPRLYEPCGRTLRAAVCKMEKLEAVSLECGQLDTGLIRRLLRTIGERLRVFETSLEGQKLAVDRQLDCIIRTIATHCPNVSNVGFREACSDCNWRYFASLPDARVSRLKASLALVKSRAPFLDVEEMEMAVAQLCGTKSEEDWSDWGA